MKQRTFLVVLLILVLVLGLLYWIWQPSTPESNPPASTTQASGTSAGYKRPELTFVTVPALVADSNDSTTPDATPVVSAVTPDGPMLVADATITVPLADAEHYMLKSTRFPGQEISILGVYQVLVGPRNGPKQVQEAIDFYMWNDGRGRQGEYGTLMVSALNNQDDQTHIFNWAKQQNAARTASNSTIPQLTGDTPGNVRLAIEMGQDTPTTPPPQN